MKTFLTILLLLGLVACGSKDTKPEVRWFLVHKAMTAEEHARVDAHVREILSHVPQSINGHDQDLDDYAKAVYAGALETLTPPRLFENELRNEVSWVETGRWRAMDAQPTGK